MKNLLSRKSRMFIELKLITYIALITLLILIPIISFIFSRLNQQSINNITKITDAIGNEIACQSKIILSESLNSGNFIRSIVESQESVIEEKRNEYIEKSITKVLNDNENISGIWCTIQNNKTANSEINNNSSAITALKNNYSCGYFRLENKIAKINNLDQNNISVITEKAIATIKSNGISFLSEPYFFSYTNKGSDSSLVANLALPIMKNNAFSGIINVDIALKDAGNALTKANLIPNGYSILLSNKGTIISHPDKKQIGKNITKINLCDNTKYRYSKFIEIGKQISFITDDKEKYITFCPITVHSDLTPWAICLVAPLNKNINIQNGLLFTLIASGIIGLTLLLLITYLILSKVLRPIKQITNTLNNLSEGIFDNKQKVVLKTCHEFMYMSSSINKLIDNMSEIEEFATEISKGNIDKNFVPHNNSNSLVTALIHIRENIHLSQKKEMEQKQLDERKQWSANGINKMSEILRQHSQSLEQLTFSALKYIIDYIDAVQGGVYIKNDDNPDDIYFEMSAAIAFGREKIAGGKIKLEEGLVGRCAAEELTIYLTEIPNDYPRIKSGLGNASPNVIIIVPMKTNNDVLGAIELISFKQYDDFEIEFLEKIGDDMALTVANVRTNQKTARLLEQSQKQSEELAQKEEQTRQTIEELNATQEEAHSKIEQISSLVNAVNQISMVAEYDTNGYLTEVNENFLRLLGVNRQQLIGRKQGSFDKDLNKDKNNNMWIKLRQGKTVTSVQKIDVGFKNIVLSETYVPIKDSQNKIIKVINIAIDITHSYEDINI